MRLADEVPAEVRDEQYRLQTHCKHRRMPELAGGSPEEKFRNDERDDAPLKRNFKGFEEALFHFFIVVQKEEFGDVYSGSKTCDARERTASTLLSLDSKARRHSLLVWAPPRGFSCWKNIAPAFESSPGATKKKADAPASDILFMCAQERTRTSTPFGTTTSR